MSDLNIPHGDQQHSPLAFLSGRFDKTQLGWSILEKEAYTVIATLERMHWIAETPNGFYLYTDHNNLIFIFDPLAVVANFSQVALRKIFRWAVPLCMYNYTCCHISGEDNVWADLLGRSSAGHTIRRIVYVPPLPSSSDPEFTWPCLQSIADAQQSHDREKPPTVELKDGIMRYSNGPIRIPDKSDDLHLRLCIIAHTGPSGHRGRVTTKNVLSENIKWTTLSDDVRPFVRTCIHCLSNIGGEKIPRQFGPAVHGTMPNDLIQFDYIENGPSSDGAKYVLMVRDDHSDFKWLFALTATTTENAATALTDWCALSGIPNGLMSVGPTHFKNETIRSLTKSLKVPHHFTLPYKPWINGAVERLGKELLRTFRAIVSELQMEFDEWPDLLPIVHSTLNTAPSPQRGNVSPITAFTGLKPTPPISTFVRMITGSTVDLSDMEFERISNIENLLKICSELHPTVQSSLQSNRKRARDQGSSGKLANFTEGDFVLVARSDFHAGEK